MTSTLEVAANVIATLSILLASRNHVHTWTFGVLGCLAFAWLYFESRLYADVMLQFFFIVTSVLGWSRWRHSGRVATVAQERPVTHVRFKVLALSLPAGAMGALAYGQLLHATTDAWAPFADSFVLAFSIVAQWLLVRRHVETWPVWLLVNSISVPLFASRGLYLTAAVYAIYWLNAWYGWRRWHQFAR